MSLIYDPLTLICFAVFAFFGFKLWQVLGTRSGPQRPLQPQAGQFKTKPLPGDLELKAAAPGARRIWEGYAAEGSALTKGLVAVGEADQNFDTSHFLEGAKSAHERILNAFATADLSTLKLLLSDQTYATFAKEMTRRSEAGETAVFKFVSFKEAKPVEATLQGDDAAITMRFVSELVSAVKNAKGEIISGDDKRIVEVAELWIFERHLKSGEAGWKLSETHDGA